MPSLAPEAWCQIQGKPTELRPRNDKNKNFEKLQRIYGSVLSLTIRMDHLGHEIGPDKAINNTDMPDLIRPPLSDISMAAFNSDTRDMSTFEYARETETSGYAQQEPDRQITRSQSGILTKEMYSFICLLPRGGFRRVVKSLAVELLNTHTLTARSRYRARNELIQVLPEKYLPVSPI
jgi:hypothetical protein